MIYIYIYIYIYIINWSPRWFELTIDEIDRKFVENYMQVNPDDIVFGGWDISDMNLADAMARARVFDIDLQKQLRPYMESMVPLPGIYDPDFIAANQGERANNVIKGTKREQINQIIKDIKYVSC